MSLVLACITAWLLGGIPFGLCLVRWFKGVDIRRIGSGNVGATNASRAFGGRLQLPVFLLIYALDFLKGFVPALGFASWFGVVPAGGGAGLLAPVLIGAAAVLGHCFSPYLGLRGGKGVATTTGVFAALEPVPLGLAIAVFLLVFQLSRQVFLGSLALGIALALGVVLREPATAFDGRLPVTVLALLVALFMFWTHRGNLARFRARRQDGAS
jgi:glycerol-3-phosphate acyltransferase PlsY